MILIWRGRGIIAIVISLLAFLAPLGIVLAFINYFPNSAFANAALIPTLVGGIALGGLVCMRLGRKWNRDQPPGETHTLYFLRVEHWGMGLLVLAGFLTVLILFLKILMWWKTFR